MKTKLPCCVVNGVCRHKMVRVQLNPQHYTYEVPHKPAFGLTTQCDFMFCEMHWNEKLQVLDRGTKAWMKVVEARGPKPYRWDYNRLHGDGSTWVPRWGTKYASELIELQGVREEAPRKGRMFSRDGTTATNLR